MPKYITNAEVSSLASGPEERERERELEEDRHLGARKDVIGATLLSVLGFFTGDLIQTRALRHWRSVDSITIFLFALPSTVFGIGLISLWNTPWTNLIYSTPVIIILGPSGSGKGRSSCFRKSLDSPWST